MGKVNRSFKMKQVCAVTGGAAGLGRGFVERFLKDGYDVVFCDVNEKLGQEVANENGSTFIKVDVTKHLQVESFFKQIKEKFGRLDVIINNAGIAQPKGKQCDIPVEDYLRMMDINLNGAWYTLKYGVKLMVECGNGGRVVNLSSLTALSYGICAHSGIAHYGVSKTGIIGLTKIMALEYAPNKIRINAVAPTVVETPLVKQFMESLPEEARLWSTGVAMRLNFSMSFFCIFIWGT